MVKLVLPCQLGITSDRSYWKVRAMGGGEGEFFQTCLIDQGNIQLVKVVIALHPHYYQHLKIPPLPSLFPQLFLLKMTCVQPII